MKISFSDQDKIVFKVTGFVLGVVLVAIALYIFLPGIFPDGSLLSEILFFAPVPILYIYAFKLAEREEYFGLKIFFILMLVLDFYVIMS